MDLTPLVPLRRSRATATTATTSSQGSSTLAADGSGALSAGERAALVALAEVVLPGGHGLPAGGPETVRRFEAWLGEVPEVHGRVLRAAIQMLDAATLPTRRARLSRLPFDERLRALRALEDTKSFPVRALVRAVTVPLKRAHFDDPAIYAAFDVPWSRPSTTRDETPRWWSQVTNGRELSEDLELECEVVVVGTGAGGAAAAYELARRGRAVVLLEEGDYHRRSELRGTGGGKYQRFYRDFGLTIGLGNVGAPIWAGKAVGGSTFINSGTCYRSSERVFSRWRRELGLPAEFSEVGLHPYFERVEAMLGVETARDHLGTIGDIIARGADKLGLHHGPLARNAPGCDGQGHCAYGCPTGAKRSTDVSYVPAALERGAMLVTAARVSHVDVVAGRAVGVSGTLLPSEEGGPRRTFKVKADAVIVAGGALMTPLLLDKSGACQTSGQLGKNLSIHPASVVFAKMPERVDQSRGIPQSYAIDQFMDRGLMFEGGSLPPDLAAASFPYSGHGYMEAMASYPHLATFGFMIEDESRGQVRRGPGGSPLLTYNLSRRDVRRMHEAFGLLAEVYLEAGAEVVYPFVLGHEELRSKSDVERLRRAELKAGDFEVVGFHPLGTCKVGRDPKTSCVDPEHEAHDVRGLYVMDGSAVPSALGVNPQLTIMALALRAAEHLDARLS
jgi:choline dehydrogenase-like flavoprotein